MCRVSSAGAPAASAGQWPATIPAVEQLLRVGLEPGAITVKPARRASLDEG